MNEQVKDVDNCLIVKMIPEDYGLALEMIANKIKDAQARAIRAINFELVSVYRDIGQIIHEKQADLDGEHLLSSDWL